MTIRDAYAKTDRGIDVAVGAAPEAASAWTDEGTRSLLDLLAIVPSGPLAMSADFEGLVETSTSVDEAITENGRLTLHSLSRSSNGSALPDVIAELDAAAQLAGGSFEMMQVDPGWRPVSTRLPSPFADGCTSVSSTRLRSSRRCMPGSRLP